MKNKVFISVLIITYSLMSSCAQEKDYLVTIKTDQGEMIAILYDETPKHKENFIKLAKEHYFDSLLFHRVIEGFMIQGGDPDSKNALPGKRLGSGGPGYTIDAEFNPKFIHEKGALSAARLGDQVNPTKASSGSQFYIVQGTVLEKEELTIDPQKLNFGLSRLLLKPEYIALEDTLKRYYKEKNIEAYKKKILELIPLAEKEIGQKIFKDVPEETIKKYTTVGGTPMLDGGYTVFGKVIKGLDVLDKIAALPKDPSDRPYADVRMIVTVEEVSKSEIEETYGYKYP